MWGSIPPIHFSSLDYLMNKVQHPLSFSCLVVGHTQVEPLGCGSIPATHTEGQRAVLHFPHLPSFGTWDRVSNSCTDQYNLKHPRPQALTSNFPYTTSTDAHPPWFSQVALQEG